MRKILSKSSLAALFLAAFILNISSNPTGDISLIKKAKAQESTWVKYSIACQDGSLITLCGAGGTGCTPQGQCGKK